MERLTDLVDNNAHIRDCLVHSPALMDNSNLLKPEKTNKKKTSPRKRNNQGSLRAQGNPPSALGNPWVRWNPV